MKVLLAAFAAGWLFCIHAFTTTADTTARFDVESGLFVLTHHTVEIAKASFVFWPGKSKFRSPDLATDKSAPFPARCGDKGILSAPITSQVAFKARPGLVAHALSSDGRHNEILAPYESGAYHLALDASLGTYWIAFRDTP